MRRRHPRDDRMESATAEPLAAPPTTGDPDPDRIVPDHPDQQHRHHHGKTLHIAPMMHTSTREFRELFRILSRHCSLWTEMVVDETLFYNNTPVEGTTSSIVPEHLLDPCHDAIQHPTVCQIGGIRPEWTTVASRLIAQAGYHELNLNLGCPSSRVQGKQFGAMLMQYPETVTDLLKAMRANFDHDKPISVKCRIGIEDPSVGDDSGRDGPTDWKWLESLIERLSPVCQRFVIHARSVRLKGLNPTQNRSIPPLDYTVVYRLCRRFPSCDFWINGGIQSLKQAKDIVLPEHRGRENSDDNIDKHAVPCSLCGFANGSCIAPPQNFTPTNLRGAMLGRAAMEDPAQFWDVDRYWYGARDNPIHTRREIVDQYCSVLAELYPHRCCDDCQEITNRLPAPRVVHNKPFCSVCDPAVFPAMRAGDSFNINNAQANNSANESGHPKPPIKIGSIVIGRCFKPVLGLFVGLPGSRAFRHACNRMSRCPVRRNCGPAFLLRLAVAETISDELLDQPLIRTEDRP